MSQMMLLSKSLKLRFKVHKENNIQLKEQEGKLIFWVEEDFKEQYK